MIGSAEDGAKRIARAVKQRKAALAKLKEQKDLEPGFRFIRRCSGGGLRGQ